MAAALRARAREPAGNGGSRKPEATRLKSAQTRNWPAREADGVGPGREEAYDDDVQGPEKGSDELAKVARRHLEPAAHRDDVEAHDGEAGSDPALQSYAPSEEEADDGHEYHVEARDEGGVARGRGHDTHLLEARADEEDGTGDGRVYHAPGEARSLARHCPVFPRGGSARG